MHMKNKSLLSLSFLLVMSACSPSSKESDLKNFEWLLGKWERVNENPEKTTFENWERHSPTTLKGTGITLKGQDTIFMEKLRIEIRQENIYYIPEVAHNAAPVLFKIQECSNTGFTAENPDHDFPKKIAYQKTGNGMKATISGDGRSIDFIFRRTN